MFFFVKNGADFISPISMNTMQWLPLDFLSPIILMLNVLMEQAAFVHTCRVLCSVCRPMH